MEQKIVDPKRAAELLRQAAENIEAASALLDVVDQGCKACGRRHWRNLTHAKIYESLSKTTASLSLSSQKLEAEVTRQQQALSAKEQ